MQLKPIMYRKLVMNWRSLVFPVVGVSAKAGTDEVEMDRLYGTASYLGGGYYITAGHVVRAARESESFGLAYSDTGKPQVRIAYTGESEILTDFDVGIIKPATSVPRTVTMLNWSVAVPSMGVDVQTIGFPHGHDPERAAVSARTLKGYVTSTSRRPEKDVPRHFDLSFSCPKQLSGAPVFSRRANQPQQLPDSFGIIVGNSSTSLLISEHTEEFERVDGSGSVAEREVVTRHDTVFFGRAIAVESFASANSELIDGSLMELWAGETEK